MIVESSFICFLTINQQILKMRVSGKSNVVITINNCPFVLRFMIPYDILEITQNLVSILNPHFDSYEVLITNTKSLLT